ncbi:MULTISPECIES: PP2C family protein-serine/threonine phosphatase [unclassified Fusibacter]|uniref:PP2C family protein-serine/threonine phosphatase n=1 Tax=unclassified Fusibacter TaxID=2624464 RepID=UPI001013A015|nr:MULTISPECIES: SpoIIE family protein phosphatase [unclassified Fusibacter]MCK8060983.1 SpoIIE family protein phosphatase [Fusibacter sp. A2]NPE20563.1 SpoIIE family protein phosphatase [Fusibacter sp. A1]RXV63760.1 hypothetical protein DWB64_01930 [Fusibacter sp. A1]
MEMLQAKAKERHMLLVEFGLIVGVCIAGLFFYVQMHDRIAEIYLSYPMMFMAGTTFNIVLLVSAFLLFNTTYYSFVSYRGTKMLILSTTSGYFAVVYLFYFILNALGAHSTALDTAFMRSEVILTFLLFVFAVGTLTSSFIDNDIKFMDLTGIKKGMPFAIGLALSAVTFVSMHLLGRIDSQPLFDRLNQIFLSAAILLTLSVIVMKIRNYILTLERIQIRLAVSAVFMTSAMVLRLLPPFNGPVRSLFFYIYLIAGLLIYVYAIFKYNISIPVKHQKNAEQQVKLYAENLEKIVQKRTADMRKANMQFIRDIEYAKNIQQSLLPGTHLEFENTDFVAAYYPCERLSGDFYDVFRIDPETIGMYVLDVSGHGVPAALMTMFCMNYIKSSERLINVYRAKKPQRNLKHFFEAFNKMNFPDEMHMVMFIASYDEPSRVLTYCSGGMNTLPYVVRQNGEVIRLDDSTGFPICKVGSFYTPEFHSAKIELSVGDRVFFYTDGLTDKGKTQIYDDKKIIDLMLSHRKKSIQGIKEVLTSEIGSVAHKLDDDITFIIMDITK